MEALLLVKWIVILCTLVLRGTYGSLGARVNTEGSVSDPTKCVGMRNITTQTEWSKELCDHVIKKTNVVPGPACNYDQPEWEFTSDLLITGTARSGTFMIAKLSKDLGIELSDDNHPPEAGMIAWQLAVKGSRKHFHAEGRQFRFRNIIHLVRDPLKCIVSLRTELKYWKKGGASLMDDYVPGVTAKEIAGKTEDELLLFGLQVYVHWHQLIRKQPATVVQVENFCDAKNLEALLDYTCRKPPIEGIVALSEKCKVAYEKYKGTNTRIIEDHGKHCDTWMPCYSKKDRMDLTWKKLQEVDASLAKEAYRLAVEEFGYKYDAEATKIPNDWRGKL